MSLPDVFQFVQGELSPDPRVGADDAFIYKFLERMLHSPSVFSQRLMICIGIDLKAYKKAFGEGTEFRTLAETYRGVILAVRRITKPTTYGDRELEPHLEFTLAVKEYGAAKCIPMIRDSRPANYVRITSFDSYFRWILMKNLESNPALPANLTADQVTMRRFYKEFSVRGKYNEIFISNLGSSTGWVFTADRKDVDEDIAKGNVSSILDRIGYYMEDTLGSKWERKTYVFLDYPPDFNEQMLQPTALQGDWGNIDSRGNEFYISYRFLHQWGVTFPVTGGNNGVKERIHNRFSYSPDRKYFFRLGNLAELKAPHSKVSDSKIIEEAINRFKIA